MLQILTTILFDGWPEALILCNQLVFLSLLPVLFLQFHLKSH
ncbi:MAG: hypothetical protein AVDCRST_MAG96-2873 [uncultured Segetibacter sp.]|uniref:Uncharacterized protein n=1 Tax=uncultured Segetibacter sp. TaxID=481133 RepID=A0A6J4TDQ9_9BACT|nr:MAG: hypothetical protein AVDCRST_MAG96-2873 [uncultured Segetibacter sp.]